VTERRSRAYVLDGILTGHLQETGDYYIFKNIQYAEQPVGELRFREPIPPLQNQSSQISAGTQDVMCPQAVPGWIAGLSTSQGANLRRRAIAAAETIVTESCLVLDVYVPTEVFSKGRAAKGL